MTDQPGIGGNPVPAEVVDGELIVDPPAGWVEAPWPPVMTNLDLSINQDVAKLLRQGGRYSRHTALDFNGLVWVRDGRWHEAVWVHRRYVASYQADTPEHLMLTVNAEHGWT